MASNGSPAKTPPSKTFVKMTREVLESPALWSLGVNAHRFVLFLMLEHLKRRSMDNGKLKAPHRQLVERGISPGLVAPAIREAEASGLVVAHRGGMRVATTYELTWLPTHAGSAPTDRWRTDNLPIDLKADSRNLPIDPKAALPTDLKADGPKLPTDLKADGLKTGQNLPTLDEALLKNSYQGRSYSSGLRERHRLAARQPRGDRWARTTPPNDESPPARVRPGRG